MGIASFEDWLNYLQELVPNAFSPLPPAGFEANTLVIDGSEQLHNAFMSRRARTGDAYVDVMFNRISELMTDRYDSENEWAEKAAARDDISLADVESWRATPDKRQVFLPRVADSAILVMPRDDSRYTTRNRELLHVDRKRETPLTPDEIRDKNIHCKGSLPMPGHYPDGSTVDDFNK